MPAVPKQTKDLISKIQRQRFSPAELSFLVASMDAQCRESAAKLLRYLDASPEKPRLASPLRKELKRNIYLKGVLSDMYYARSHRK